MGRASSIRSLPVDLRQRAEALIRQHDYAQIDHVLARLVAEGVSISRSGLHRYAQQLKERDGLYAGNPDRTVVVLMDRATGNVTTLTSAAEASVVAQAISKLADVDSA